MKLKCNHDRRVMVLISGRTIHRNDGSGCRGTLSMGNKRVSKMLTINEIAGMPIGSYVLAIDKDPAEDLDEAIFTKPLTPYRLKALIGNPLEDDDYIDLAPSHLTAVVYQKDTDETS